MAESDSKRIAKNTLVLYCRMILSMLVSLYTSRVVLEVLGVSDFGVYGVVGGVIGMFSFLNSSMSGATSRFITFELGKGDADKLQKTFSSAFWVHLGVAVIVFVLCETIGLWFLVNKLVIPPEARLAAMWVYQLSVIAAMISITQVPYTACIISHEKMSIYAYIEIINALLKLGAVWALIVIPGAKLIVYAFLLLAISTIVAMIYRIYAIKKFSECKISLKLDKAIIKPMVSFSGWDIYGNLCGMAFYQGTTFLLNIFFGVVTNAANSIGNTVAGVLIGLSNNVTAAYRPHIIKQYAKNNITEMSRSMNQGLLAVMILSALVGIPAFIEMPQLIRLWLGQEPQYTVVFCRLLIIFFLLGQINAYLVMAIHATGKIKWLSFAGGTIYLITIPAIWLAFKQGLSPEWAYIIHVAGRFIIIGVDALIMHNLIVNFPMRTIFVTIVKTTLLIAGVFVVCWYAHLDMTTGLLRMVCITALSSFMLFALSFTLLLNKSQRATVLAKLSSLSRRYR